MTDKEIVANLRGIFLPIVTPFDRRGGVDEGRFRDNLRRYVETGLAGIVVAGSTGEAPYLAERERLRLVEIARKIVRPPQLVVAGTGLESTRATLLLSREAVARGADVLLVVTPSYFKSRMDSAALTAHYRAVADGVRRPVEIYSIPQFTGVRIGVDTLARLSRHPNIVGLKESSGDLAFLRAILRKVRPNFRVLVGSALILLEGLRAGAVGGVLGQAGFVPELCVALYEAFRRGQMRMARDLEKRLGPLVEKINVPYGVAGIKAALDLCGYAGGAPRSPLLPLAAQARRAVVAAVREARAGLEF
jgi:4-hydroxy-2-oxoglutarate aldolase